MTDKQERFVQSLVDQIGFRNSPRRSEYLAKVLQSCTELYSFRGGIDGTSKVIEKLLAEKQLRNAPTPKKFHSQHLAVTDLSAFAFCPASYVIAETFEIEETERMLEGEELHGKRFLQNFLLNLRNKRIRQIEQSRLEGGKAEKYLYRGSLGDLLNSRLVFAGHETKKREAFYSKNKTLAGIPDYIFERPDKTNFVVEEKHTWRQEEISSPFPNHLIQILAYVYGLESLQLSYGYVIYFHWCWFKGSLSTSKVKTFRVTKSTSTKKQLVEIFQNVRSLKNGVPAHFDPATLNTEKCFGCSVRALCKHKSGRHDILQFPYYRRQNK